jgi:endo-1,4-beta-xylanase
MPGSYIISRREVLAGVAAATGLTVIDRCTKAWARGVRLTDSPYQPAVEPLQLAQLAANKGVLYGTAIFPSRMPLSPGQWDAQPYCQMIRRQSEAITNAYLHFGLVQPIEGHFNFTMSDRIAEYALRDGLRMRGHALCWYREFPTWMAKMDRATAIQALENHIGVVVARYAGKVHSWDVVNEALNPNDDAPNAMRMSGFTRTIGWDWMDFAFHAARRADPHALLTYNEYRIEVTHYGDSDARRAGMLNLLDDFRRRDVPIDAVGIQSHIEYKAWKYFDARAFSDFLREIAARGIKIFLTELDVIDTGSPTDSAERDRIIANIYRTYLSVALENPAVTMVVNWGLFDPEAWQNSPYESNPNFRRADRTPGRGLPFDSEMRPKLAASAIAGVFENMLKR